VPLFSGNRIGKVRRAIRVLSSVSIYGMLLVVAFYGLALALARGRRREVLPHIGLAVSATGVVILLARSLAGTLVVQSVVGSEQRLEPAGGEVWRILATRSRRSGGWPS
jgi:hypothetical protein